MKFREICELVLESKGSRHKSQFTGETNVVEFSENIGEILANLPVETYADLQKKLEAKSKGLLTVTPKFILTLVDALKSRIEETEDGITIDQFKEIIVEELKTGILLSKAVNIFKRKNNIPNYNEALVKFMELSEPKRSMYIANADTEHTFVANPVKETDKFSRAADKIFSWMDKNTIIKIPTELELDLRKSKEEEASLERIAKDFEDPTTRDVPKSKIVSDDEDVDAKDAAMSPEETEDILNPSYRRRGRYTDSDDESQWGNIPDE